MNMLKIMIIEDEKDHFELMEHAIKKEFPDAVVDLCEKAELCLNRLEATGRDIIIADHLLAGMTGLQLLEELKKRKIEVPVIMVTGHGDEGLAVKAMKSGAFDYVVKSGSFFELIPEIVRKAIHDRELKAKVRQVEQENQRLQAQLLHVQKMEAFGRLAGGVAHDFNNILTTIQGFADIALMKLKEDNPLYGDLSEIRKASIKAANLTRQLLLFSRRQPMEMIPLSINSVVQNLVKMLNRLIGEDISLSTDLKPGLWKVKGDAGTIEQVIMNLVVNARDAMPEGGEITVRTENVLVDEEYCKIYRYARSGEFVCISVQDMGEGMDQTIIDHIFEPFFTTKKPGKGTGMGLSVVHGIVKQHEGWINVESSPGNGAIFRIYLPATCQPVPLPQSA